MWDHNVGARVWVTVTETEARSEDSEVLASHLVSYEAEDKREQLEVELLLFKNITFVSLYQDPQPNNLIR